MRSFRNSIESYITCKICANKFVKLYIYLSRYNGTANRAIQVDALCLLKLAWKRRFYNPKRKHSERDGIVRKPPHTIRDEWTAESTPFSSTLRKQVRVTSSMVQCKLFLLHHEITKFYLQPEPPVTLWNVFNIKNYTPFRTLPSFSHAALTEARSHIVLISQLHDVCINSPAKYGNLTICICNKIN